MDEHRRSRKFRSLKFEQKDEELAARALRVSKVVLEALSSRLEDFPWRRSENPWHILLAEVLLQRVSADRVVKVYESLVNLAPTPKEFLGVPEEQVKSLLRMLGLQNKKYALIRKLAIILSSKGSEVQVQDLDEVTGLGEFGRAVFEVFVFKRSAALLDEVVGRVFSRALGLQIKGKAVNDWKLRTVLESVVKSLTADEAKVLFYAAVDLGRKICKLKKPACSVCPLVKLCEYALKS